MAGSITLSFEAFAAMATVAAAGFGTGVFVQKYRKTKEKLIEGHKRMHEDLQMMNNKINGGNPIDREDCPVCKEEWQ